MSTVNPDIIRWARETAGFSIDEAAKKLSISADRLKAFESGEKAPTRKQISTMADKLHRPLLTFYLSVPPEHTDRGRDFRTLPEAEAASDHAVLDTLLRDIRARQKIVRSALEDEEPKPLSFIGSKQIKSGIKEVLESIRETLKLDLDTFRKQRDPAAAFSYLRKQVEEHGIFVLLRGNLGSHHTDISVDVFRGFALSDEIAPFIVINEHDSRSAWSFTLLHEVAHLWLGETGISGGISDQATEVFCNEVAGEFLLPSEDLTDLILPGAASLSEIAAQVSAFARELNLSRPMVAYKLFKRSKLNRRTWIELNTRFREEWIAEQKARQSREGGDKGAPTYYVVRRHRIGNGLISFIDRTLSAGDITTIKAGKVLGVNPSNVGRLLYERQRTT